MIPEKLKINKFGDLVAIYADETDQILLVRTELIGVSKKTLNELVHRYNGYADLVKALESIQEMAGKKNRTPTIYFTTESSQRLFWEESDSALAAAEKEKCETVTGKIAGKYGEYDIQLAPPAKEKNG